MSKLIFKVYENVSHNAEIRKFYVDVKVAKNFTLLRGKLETIFPILQTTKYYLKWQDENRHGMLDFVRIENDSNEELEIAINEMNDKLNFCEFFIYSDED
ncbi:hypothetical protein CAJAP_04454 [Camponotus japonicus]